MKRIRSLLACGTIIIGSIVTVSLVANAAGSGGSACQADGVPKAYAYVADDTGTAPHTTQIEVKAEGCGDEIVDYSWNFGDGATGNGNIVEHSFGAGTWTVTVTVTDQAGLTSTGTDTLEVRAINAIPVAGDDTYTFTNYSFPAPWSYGISGNDSDNDGDWLTYSVVTPPAHGRVILSNGTMYFTAEVGYFGTDSFTYRVSDVYGGVSNPATVSLTMKSPNNSPVARNDSASTQEDTPVNINVLANDSDPDGNPLSVSIPSVSTDTGTFSVNPDNTVTYLPAKNFNGLTGFYYKVSDGEGAEATAYVSLSVGAVNDAPVAGNDTASTNEDTAVEFSVLGNDSDVEGPLTTSIMSGPTHGSVTLQGNGYYRYTPAANYYGSDSFSYRVVDSGGLTSTAQVTLTVNSVNDVPIAQFTQSLAKVRTVIFTNQSSDKDSDALAYLWAFGDGTTSTAASPTHSYVKKGSYTVSLKVTDTSGATSTVTKIISP